MEEFKNNKKFQETLKTAKKLFWKYGIKRVSINEICAETPISKMTFYKFFKNKEVLAGFILNKIFTGLHQEYRMIMDQDIPFTSRIKQVINHELKASEDMGEVFIMDIFNNEFTQLQKQIREYTERYNAEIVNDMIEAQKQGEIRKDIKPEFILYLLEDINKKIMDDKLSALYSSKQELIVELANYFFYGIMNNKE